MTPDAPLGSQPSRMPPADLGSAFSPPTPPQAPNRSRGLAGKLAPVPPPPAPVAPPDTATSPTKTPPTATPRATKPGPAPKKTTEREHASGDEPGSGGVKPIVVYLPASLRVRLRAAATPEVTHTDVVLDALDATHEQLAQRFAPTSTQRTSMFTGRGHRRRLRHDEPQVQVSLRPLADDLTIIDGLTTTLGAPSRSALIAAALDLHLP